MAVVADASGQLQRDAGTRRCTAGASAWAWGDRRSSNTSPVTSVAGTGTAPDTAGRRRPADRLPTSDNVGAVTGRDGGWHDRRRNGGRDGSGRAASTDERDAEPAGVQRRQRRGRGDRHAHDNLAGDRACASTGLTAPLAPGSTKGPARSVQPTARPSPAAACEAGRDGGPCGHPRRTERRM